MAVGAFWFSVMSVLVKLAGQRLPSMEIVFFRGILTLAMSYVIVKRAGITPVLGNNRKLLLQRGILGAAALACFLFSLTQEQLSRAAFPVGHLDKPSVRAHAERLKLHVTQKPDSQEICFVPDGDYAAFVERQAPEATRPGTVVAADGRVLGTHAGVHRFTIGQRKGLGLSSSEPLYVTAIHPEAGQVVVGSREDLGRTSLTASTVNWISGEAPSDWRRVTAQIRHRHAAAPAKVRGTDDGRAELEFDAPQTAVTPGQAVVFYDRDEVLGGGWID